MKYKIKVHQLISGCFHLYIRVIWHDLWFIVLRINIAQSQVFCSDTGTCTHFYQSAWFSAWKCCRAFQLYWMSPSPVPEERGEWTWVLSVQAPLPSLHIRGHLAFGREAQSLRGAKWKRAHFGADARVRPPGPSRRAVQQAHQVFAKVVPHEAVHNGVDTAVEIGDADGDRHGGVDYFQQRAVIHFGQLGEDLHQVEHLMGSPAQEERQHSCSQHAQHLIIPGTGAFLDSLQAQQCPSDEAVTGNDDYERD